MKLTMGHSRQQMLKAKTNTASSLSRMDNGHNRLETESTIEQDMYIYEIIEVQTYIHNGKKKKKVKKKKRRIG